MMSNILFCMVNYISVSTDTLEGVKRGTKRAALCPRGQVHRTQQPGVRWMRAWRRLKAIDEGNRMAMFFGFETVHKQSLRWLFVWMFVSLPAVSWKKKVTRQWDSFFERNLADDQNFLKKIWLSPQKIKT
jgi:hypothetical protein